MRDSVLDEGDSPIDQSKTALKRSHDILQRTTAIAGPYFPAGELASPGPHSSRASGDLGKEPAS